MRFRSKILYRFMCNGCNSIYLGKLKDIFSFERLSIQGCLHVQVKSRRIMLIITYISVFMFKEKICSVMDNSNYILLDID